MDQYIDVVIPRGGKSLIKAISKKSKIPLFKHLDGNCHCYVNESCAFDKARKIIINAKMRRVGICGATESLVIDKKISQQIIPLICDDLTNYDCEIVGDLASQKLTLELKKPVIVTLQLNILIKKYQLKLSEIYLKQ